MIRPNTLWKAIILLTLLLATGISQRVAAQDTNKFPGTGNAGVNTTSPPNPFTIVRSGDSPYTSRPAYELLQLVDKTDNTPQVLFGSNYNGMFLRYTSTSSTSASQRLGIFTGSGAEVFAVNNDGNVGIGTTSPSERLAITSASGIDSYLLLTGGPGLTRGGLKLGNGGNTYGQLYFDNTNNNVVLQQQYTSGDLLLGTNSTTNLTIKSGGNVGIGITSPGYRLDVQGGQVNASGGFCIAGDCKTAWSQVGGSGSSQWASNSSGINYSSGNVGIGTTTPATQLDVNGDIRGTRGTFGVPRLGPNYELQVYSSTGADRNIFAAGVSGFSNGFKVDYGNSPQTMKYTFVDGNVGIGTTVPDSKLSVDASTSGNAAVAQFINSSIGVGNSLDISIGKARGNATSFVLDYIHDTNSAVRALDIHAYETYPQLHLLANGNVGIGTTSPQYKVTIGASDGAVGFYSDSTHYGNMVFYDGTYGGMVFNQNTAAGGGYRFNFNTTNLMSILGNGNVGIGEPSPNEKLEVVGNLKLTGPGNINATGTIEAGNIKAKYQDVAEWVPASEQLSAGTVVVLDSTKSNQVASSSVSYDTRVAGVVSEQPGIALGEKSEGKVLVATTGRVRVKVDATKGPIHIGDLLVTSDVSGVAMKSEAVNLGGVQIHRPGTLIGKALEPLEKGEGEILVLLSLQ
jgi:hypothetical protein